MDREREAMVRLQLERRGIHDPQVLQAMLSVPRHRFVPRALQHLAYRDRALPIEDGQTISQPFIVAIMAQSLSLTGNERVLEIGTGTGYAAAVLSRIAGTVVTVEVRPDLARLAAERLQDLGYTNVEVQVGDGTCGWPAGAPYDAISVPAAAPWVPRPLREQLSEGGRIVIPVGGRDEQVLLRLHRNDGHIYSERLTQVRFVPLIGDHAWDARLRYPERIDRIDDR